MRLLIASLFLGSLMFFAFSNNDTSTAIAKDATTHVQIASVDVLTLDEVAAVEGAHKGCRETVASDVARESCWHQGSEASYTATFESVVDKYAAI